MKSNRDHYETLGVKPDASPKEIKNARRRKAAKSHPDHGGDQVEMSQINHAFDVLIDPKRRLLYDRTGEDNERPRDEQIRELLTAVFADGLQKDVAHILNHAKECLKQGKQTLEQQMDQITKQRDKLKARRDKITVKSGENAFQMIIDQEIPKLEQQIAKLESDLDICKGATDELKKYKSSEEVPVYTMSNIRFSNQWSVFGGQTT